MTVIESFNVNGNTSIGGLLGVSGAATFNNTLTVVGANATSLGGTLDVTGAATLSDTLTVTNLAALNGGIDVADFDVDSAGELTVSSATVVNNLGVGQPYNGDTTLAIKAAGDDVALLVEGSDLPGGYIMKVYSGADLAEVIRRK